MQGLLEAINRHAAALGMRIKALKTKVMSAVLLDGEPVEDIDKFKYLSTKEIRIRINLANPHSLA